MGNSRRGTPGFFLRYPFGNFWILVIFLCLLSASIMICVVLSIALVIMAPAAQCKSVERRDRQAPIGDGGVMGKMEAPPINNGNMEGLFSGKALDNLQRDVHTDSFKETLQMVAKEYQGKQLRREPSTRGSDHIGQQHVVTCVYCDTRCVKRATDSGYANAQAYFDVAIEQMNTIGAGLNDQMTFELSFVLLPYAVTEMSWFFDYSAKNSQELLTAINNKFWKDSGLYAMAAGNGCDLDYLVADSSDSAWSYMGSIAGIANMFQLCLGSYSTVMMDANPVEMAKLMAHEYGHMIGIYHDGEIDAAFSGMSGYFDEGQMLA